MGELAYLDVNETYTNHEAYARSHKYKHILGRLAAVGLVGTPEYIGVQEELKTDFVCAVAENLACDDELGERLSFEPLDSFKIIDGEPVDKYGKPLSRMIYEGYLASSKAAKTNDKMGVQAFRDYGDVLTVEQIKTLRVGEMYAVVSVEPKKELKQDPEFWRDEMKYSEGMAVVQVYYKKDDGTLLAGSYSLKNSDLEILRTMFMDEGIELPSGIGANEWIRHGIRKNISEEKAVTFGAEFVDKHRKLKGSVGAMYSVTDMVKRNSGLVDNYFESYIVPLSQALVTGKNHSNISSFAASILNNVDVLDNKDIHRLMRVANGNKIEAEDVDLIEEKVRYALIEDLRKIVKFEIDMKKADSSNNANSHTYSYFNGHQLNINELNIRASSNVNDGHVAGRTYVGVGCSGAGTNYGKDHNSSQNIFGGNSKDKYERKESDEDVCEYSGTFCYCCPYDNDGSPLSEPVEITARRDKDGIARCLRTGCGATLDKNGKGSKGRIYEKAMLLLKQKQSYKVAA